MGEGYEGYGGGVWGVWGTGEGIMLNKGGWGMGVRPPPLGTSCEQSTPVRCISELFEKPSNSSQVCRKVETLGSQSCKNPAMI